MPEPSDLTRTAAYDYFLPEGRIARYPAERRDGSRLLVLTRSLGEGVGLDSNPRAHPTGPPDPEIRAERPGSPPLSERRVPAPPSDFRDLRFSDLPELVRPGDLLVVNESRVLPVRLLGRKPTGAKGEVLLLRPMDDGPDGLATDRWEALVRPGSKLKPGRELIVSSRLRVTIEDGVGDGGRIVRLHTDLPIEEVLASEGRVPLPPYLEREEEPLDRERYQTVYARDPGSVAAPTAGLHFTPRLIERLTERGVGIAKITLHVGPGTFRPVEAETLEGHRMHREVWKISPEAADQIRRTRAGDGRVWAVGTTVVRTLESAAAEDGGVRPGEGSTSLFIVPGFRFRVIDGLITNFHLPRSTLLMLVAAFAGYERTMEAYRHAVRKGYRFYSYGDAMAILPLP
ncbi:MAG: tRNA preQ1(34) S-adenosylmethionine ribosyltransferase-isomerase QueA [Gemmatimonadota bacterium]